MKSLTALWKVLANECASICCTSATLDIKYVERRSKTEGISFLTITLPSFGKDFEQALDDRKVSPTLFRAFGNRYGSRTQKIKGLPRFLGGFLDLVFDDCSGELLDEPSIEAIKSIRQLTLMFGKILLPCSDARKDAAFEAFVQCEKDVREADKRLSQRDLDEFRHVSSLLFRSAFSKVDSDIYHMKAVPKHGPGKTADRLRGNEKYRLSTWTTRLEEIFPAGEFLLPNWRYNLRLDEIDILEPGSEQPVKVVDVPKTLKTPRIIAMEPTAMQYAQQAVLSLFLDAVQKDFLLSRMLGFDNQEPNQLMARRGSLRGDLATLDLSEASDRVSNQHVRNLLRRHPYFHMAVDGSRSRKADVPGRGVLRLAKFASMGSALCFPFEAAVFLTVIFIGIARGLSSTLDRSIVKQYADQVRVYGDDIIIPVDMVNPVVHALQTFGFVVNMSKSFWNGKFRESCGKEYYDGHDVSIVRVRRMFPKRRADAKEVISIVSLRNQLYKHGYWQTVRWLDSEIRGVIRHFPTVLETSPVLGRHSFLGYEAERMGSQLHNPLVKGYVERSQSPINSLDDEGALLKCFLDAERREEDLRRRVLRGQQPLLHLKPFADRKHLERSGRPDAVNIKLGWYSAV